MGKHFETQVIFWEGDSLYLLEASLHVVKAAGRGDASRWFRIDEETLWVLDAPRPNKSMIGSPDVFKQNAHVFLRRNGQDDERTVVPAGARCFLLNDVNIAAALKSEVVLANAIRGAMPGHPEVEGMRAYAREYVRE